MRVNGSIDSGGMCGSSSWLPKIVRGAISTCSVRPDVSMHQYALQVDSIIGPINASELKSPHCIPVSTSGAIFQMELSDCQQGSHQLLNSPGSLGAPQ